MSGGVDSSVAAFLLKRKGYDIVGVFMRCFNIDGCAEKDAEDARRVAEKLNIPFYIFDLEEEYKKKVVGYMINGYRKGITPNPDVMCNKEIKFGLFLEKALVMGADYVATGHYVKLISRYISNGTGRRFASAASRDFDSRSDGVDFVDDQSRRNSETFRTKHTEKFVNNYSLFISKDKNKDQSYFLWTLTQKQLKHCLFPIGDYIKPEVRKIAQKAGLPTAKKKDSQGICFLGKVPLVGFLQEYIKPKKGAVLDVGGKKIGEHKGIYFYTIGQRHGLGISGKKAYYVTEKDAKKNILRVAETEDKSLYQKEIKIKEVNFINYQLQITNHQLHVFARVRYRQPLIKAELTRGRLGCKLVFSKPIKFVAPGQSAVFYNKTGEMLGGGIIE